MMFNKETLLLSAVKLVSATNLRPDMEEKDWIKVLLIAEDRGWLYYGFEEDRLAMVSVAFRVPEVKEEYNSSFPDKDEGNILFVPFMVSYVKDKKKIYQNIKNMFNMYNDITHISYMTNGNEIKTIERGKVNGREQENRRKEAGVLPERTASTVNEPTGRPGRAASVS